ncbi:RNA-binding protein [Aspergillus candidus]|uniref:Putative peptidyl prolyl cis-trans isomerase cyclophilin n=1 Tax=Aspergillus candidus TaxID=41067 RepID=A0A2I2FHU3_ASPCN|nr:putative peptidyl prolyl cis-trans isomerase cyclophilin [Aspergillus candidus]PLB40205.1 putative peptidyl prolyl cis-trans isomerase cyclophilin [Aspergillus candidus]
MSEKARLKCTVYVGGLDQAVTVQTLAEAFVPFGEVVDITLPKPDAPNSSDLHRGFGYVEFDTPDDANEAIDNMDGSELYGRTIKVAPAKPQKDSNEGLGSKTAIWQQEGYLAKYAVSEEDKLADEHALSTTNGDRPQDPMQGLEELDVAGPKPE